MNPQFFISVLLNGKTPESPKATDILLANMKQREAREAEAAQKKKERQDKRSKRTEKISHMMNERLVSHLFKDHIAVTSAFRDNKNGQFSAGCGDIRVEGGWRNKDGTRGAASWLNISYPLSSNAQREVTTFYSMNGALSELKYAGTRVDFNSNIVGMIEKKPSGAFAAQRTGQHLAHFANGLKNKNITMSIVPA